MMFSLLKNIICYWVPLQLTRKSNGKKWFEKIKGKVQTLRPQKFTKLMIFCQKVAENRQNFSVFYNSFTRKKCVFLPYIKILFSDFSKWDLGILLLLTYPDYSISEWSCHVTCHECPKNFFFYLCMKTVKIGSLTMQLGKKPQKTPKKWR